jgi:hypothetical protein
MRLVCCSVQKAVRLRTELLLSLPHPLLHEKMQASWGTVLESRPAGPAPLDQVLLATGVVTVASLVLGWVLLAHRTGRITWFDSLIAWTETLRVSGRLAGWAAIPLFVAMLSLITALFGMYWDIALHIGVGRDEGPLANPAHYPILIGLFGLSAAGALACALPRGDQAGPGGVQLAKTWRAPIGGLLLMGAGAYALLGFPLDDVWHRLFGQDVTLWGPTHLMLIGGAGLSLVGMALLQQEGTLPSSEVSTKRDWRSYAQRTAAMGGMLIGLSVFQAEFDFGVPQFRLVLQPLLIAAAAGLTLVAARCWVGPGGAIGAVAFYVLVRGGVSLVVGPLVIGELWSAIPLYVVEALCVEAAAVYLVRRPLALGALSGLLIGTVGFAAEFWWTGVVFPLPWTSDILLEGMLMALAGGVSGGICGALLALGLQRRLPSTNLTRALYAGSVLAIAVALVNGLWITRPDDLSATIRPSTTSDGSETDANAVVEFERPPIQGDKPAWLTITAWQGGGQEGLHIDHLRRIDDTTYETTEEMPIGGTWKTLVRLQDGRDLSALPIFMPADSALGEEVLPAEETERSFGDEKEILQRELKDDVAGWLPYAAGLVVLICSLVLILALGWGVSRYNRLGNAGRDPADPDSADGYGLHRSRGAS